MGNKTSSGQRTRRQHVVPQFYLRRFTDDGFRLYAFDKGSGTVSHPHIRKVARHDFFYDLPNDNDQFTENLLGKLEDVFSRLLTDMLETVDAEGISVDQKEALAFFLLVQASRTGAFRERMLSLFSDSGAHLKDYLEREDNSGSEPDLSTLDKFDGTAIARWHVAFMDSKRMRDLAKPLLDKIWYVGINNTTDLLYTSDSPALILRPSGEPIVGSGVFGDGPLKCLFPLTPKHILVVVDRESNAEELAFENSVKPLDLKTVQSYNGQQVWYSDTHVFSQSDNFLYARQVCSTYPDVCKSRR